MAMKTPLSLDAAASAPLSLLEADSRLKST
jgi:hypothetical protein